MAVLPTIAPPTPGMNEAAAKSDRIFHALTGRSYPFVQIVTVGELLSGKRLAMPGSRCFRRASVRVHGESLPVRLRPESALGQAADHVASTRHGSCATDP